MFSSAIKKIEYLSGVPKSKYDKLILSIRSILRNTCTSVFFDTLFYVIHVLVSYAVVQYIILVIEL